MTSGNWLQCCSRSPASWIHYHLLLSSNVQTCCCLLLLTLSTSLFVRDACLSLKSAVLPPLLKKPNTDFLQFKNFRPISNLKALSKFVAAIQLKTYLTDNKLLETFQSTYVKYIILPKLLWSRFKMIRLSKQNSKKI